MFTQSVIYFEHETHKISTSVSDTAMLIMSRAFDKLIKILIECSTTCTKSFVFGVFCAWCSMFGCLISVSNIDIKYVNDIILKTNFVIVLVMLF